MKTNNSIINVLFFNPFLKYYYKKWNSLIFKVASSIKLVNLWNYYINIYNLNYLSRYKSYLKNLTKSKKKKLSFFIGHFLDSIFIYIFKILFFILSSTYFLINLLYFYIQDFFFWNYFKFIEFLGWIISFFF